MTTPKTCAEMIHDARRQKGWAIVDLATKLGITRERRQVVTQETGFKNAPSITEFKVGMRVYGDNGDPSHWFKVLIVVNGEAGCFIWSRCLQWISQKAISDFTLDLDSIWVGREYVHRPTSHRSRVCLVSDTDVVINDVLGQGCAWPRSEFCDKWTPVPLHEPVEQPKTCGDCNRHNKSDCPHLTTSPYANNGACSSFKPKPAPEPWIPGQSCLTNNGNSAVGTFLCIHPHYNHTAIIQEMDGRIFDCDVAELRPVPPGTQVKTCPHCGAPARLVHIDGWWRVQCSENCTLFSKTETEAIGKWNKLVPVQEGVKP